MGVSRKVNPGNALETANRSKHERHQKEKQKKEVEVDKII